MIHVVTKHNRLAYRDLLSEMHRLRRVHFVEERGWTAMTVRDGGEYDPYDDDSTIYLLAIEPDGSIACSMRMRPALTGSVLGDVFPHLIAEDEASIYASDVWEISRYFATGAARGRSGAPRRAEIRLASLEVALKHRAKRLVGMIDLEMLPPMLDGSGWRVRTLGLPAPYDEGVAQAVEVQVSLAALRDMEELTGLSAPLTLELDPELVPGVPPQEIEAMLRAANSVDGRRRMALRIIQRVAELQDEISEEELAATVEYLGELIARGESARL
jgi:acyl-homoserine lactone synthase